MSLMEGNFDVLYDRIIGANESSAYKSIKKLVKETEGNAIIVGSGGSFVVASYISNCLKCFSSAIKPREVFFQKLEYVDNVFLITYSGTTPDIMQCMEQCKKFENIKKIIVITLDGSNIQQKAREDNRIEIIEYKNNYAKENSYISIAATLMPISLFTRQSIEAKGNMFDKFLKECLINVQKEIEDLSKNINWTILKNNPYIEIIYETETKSAAALLESNFTETGMVYTVTHEKKDYSHGRHALKYNKKTPIVLFLKNSKDTQYDKELIDILNDEKESQKLVIFRSSDLGQVGEFEILLKSMYLTKNIAQTLGVDISRVKYPEKARCLYNYDMSLI